MNRIDELFLKKRSERKSVFIAFVTAGDPDLKTTKELVLNFEKKGVDLIELGIPFSDPLADGTTIQASSQRALKKHTSLVKVLKLVKDIRARSQVPIALMTYYNPIFHYGDAKFAKDASLAGVDGVIVPDLPPEEARVFIQSARKKNLATTFFLSPTTKEDRIKKIADASTGFIYYVPLTGVTGARKQLSKTYKEKLKLARKYTNKPICVGFGISTPDQVRAVSKEADGVIVGSAIVNEIQRNSNNKKLVQNVSNYVSRLVKGIK